MKKYLLFLVFLWTISTLEVPSCGSPKLPHLRFQYWNGTADPQDSTIAQLCHFQQHLRIDWQCIDSDVRSPYEKCNDPLYNADAVQVFIATDNSYPTKYYELEISPRSQLFFADITNPTGFCSKLGTQYMDCDLAQYSSKLTAKGWQATLKIRLDLISRGQPLKHFKINLFRIDVTSGKTTKYLAWQPTKTSTPCFHVPSVFQDITLV